LLDINVKGIWLHMGNPLELTTTNPEIVGAINEINAKQASVRVLKAETTEEALIESSKPENKDVFVYVAREVQP
jgi:TusA-related sulfurtransferase